MSNASTIDLASGLSTKTRTDRIIQAMLNEVEKHELEVVENYPLNINEHNRLIINQLEGSSAIVGWCVGNMFSELTLLGIHPKDNNRVNYFAKHLTKNLKFYKIVLNGFEDFKIVEITRDQFALLDNTPIPFDVTVDQLSFTLSNAGIPIVTGTIEGGFNRQTHVNENTATLHALVSHLTPTQKIAATTSALHIVQDYLRTPFFTLQYVWENESESII